MISNGIDTVTRLHVWTDDYNEQKQFGKVVWASPAGQQYLRNFEHNDENLQIVFDAIATLYPNVRVITTDMFLVALKAVMDAGDLQRKALEPAPVLETPAAVPTDKNGRPLTSAQIKWGEYQRFLAESSSAQVSERRRIDRGFREFCQHNVREQMAQEIDGAVVVQDDIRPRAPRVDDTELSRLQKFAEDFNALPAAAARRKMLAGFNPQWESFTKDFEKCRALRLL